MPNSHGLSAVTALSRQDVHDRWYQRSDGHLRRQHQVDVGGVGINRYPPQRTGGRTGFATLACFQCLVHRGLPSPMRTLTRTLTDGVRVCVDPQLTCCWLRSHLRCQSHGATRSVSAAVEFIPPARLPAPAFETADVVVAAPLEVTRPTRTNVMIRFLPAVMALATVGMMAVVYFSRSAVGHNPAFMTFPLMMLLSAVATVVSGADRQRGEINAERAEYLGYLSDLRGAAAKTAAAQRCSLVWCHPDPDTLWTLVGGCRMWERRVADPDFCHVRVGTGKQRLATRLVPPPMGPVQRLDPVTGDRVASISANPLDSPGHAHHHRSARDRSGDGRREHDARTSAVTRDDLSTGRSAQSEAGIDCRCGQWPQPSPLGLVEMVAAQPTSARS